jgi:hypothetical protein
VALGVDVMNNSTVILTDDADELGNVADVHDHSKISDQCVPVHIDADNSTANTDLLDVDDMESCDVEYIDGHLYHFNSVEPQEVVVQASSPRPMEQSYSHQMIGCMEATALHDITGWALSKALAGVSCSVCREAFVASAPTDSDYSFYTSSRSYGGLVHPTDYMLGAMKMLESVFLSYQSTIHETSNLHEKITQEAVDVLDAIGYKFPECHDVLYKVIRKYIGLRIHSFGVSTTRAMVNKKQFGSKTACRNTIIQ